MFALKKPIFLRPIHDGDGSSNSAWSIASEPHAPGRDMNSILAQPSPVIEDRMISVRSHDQIVPLPAPHEIYLGVIDGMVCAN